MALSTLERQLLLGQTVDRSADAQTDQSAEALAALLSQGQYEQVLRSEAAQYLFRTLAADEDVTASSLQATAQQQAQQFATQHGAAGWASLTWIGAAALQAFIQTNWTGPEFLMDPAELLLAVADKYKEGFIAAAPTELPEGASKHEIGRRDQLGRVYLGAEQSKERAALDQSLLEMLAADGEEAYTLTPRPLFLALARWLLVDMACDERDQAVGSARWWASRALLAQQSLLEYPAQSLLDQIMDGYSAVEQQMPAAPAEPVPELGEDSMVEVQETVHEPMSRSAATHTWDAVGAGDRELWARLSMEHGVAYAQHQMTRDAVQQLTAAQAASGLQWEITGAKGKRTRFQEFDTAQLVLLAQSAQPARKADQGAAPESFALNDDTLLEQIAFTDLDISGQQQLRGLDASVLLALCLNVQNENPAHGLTSEQMMPFVVRVLQHPGNWSIYTMALLQRSRLEAAKTRTVERATLQLQALVDQISHPLPEAHEAGPCERLQFFHALALPSQWELERELAKQFMALGVVRSALDIFERLHMWDEVIACYQMLGQEEVAERIIREQLDLAPSRPKLWCLLGDLKQDPAHWRHAWDVSGCRYARAMRSLGAYHFARSEFGRLRHVLQARAEAQPAVRALVVYPGVVHIDYENSEAWNNLASIHMRSNDASQRQQAWYALREALKGKYDSWQIWSNFLTASMALDQIGAAIHALDRIVQLRAEKDGAACVDLDILRGIISSLTRGTLTRNDNEREARRKEQQYSKYIEHLLITNSAPLWRAMADFWFWRRDYKHCLDCYIKAYRCYSQMPQVSYAPPVFKDAVDAALELADMYENLGDKVQVVKAPSAQDGQQQHDQEVAGDDQRKAAAIEQPVCSDWKHQTKMLLRGLIGKGKGSFEGTPDYERLVEALKELRQA
ncbi:TPR-like protein [Linderina pennispora]|uniref:TPR-like protein n=1 Tax=Linderina pennispora TaxID=61395 RepID=A0A1Y1VT77_9FUNG|nr:TPR-like protein [Linderina pennispora]ORX64488.1 TPR-like protein [Linderina pennispora]